MLLDRSDEVTASRTAAPEGADVARLRLVCLVRAGDGYVVRAVGDPGELRPDRRQLDISFGNATDRGHAMELEAAVRQIQRWCDHETTVALAESAGGLVLRAADGTEVVLPRGA